MSKTSEELRAELDKLLDDFVPDTKSVAEVVELNPWQRQPYKPEKQVGDVWEVEQPNRVTSARLHKPSYVERLAEIQQANARAARLARLRADPCGIWESEDIEDVVLRQDLTR